MKHLALTLAIALTAACSASSKFSPDSSAAELQGEWRLTEISGQSADGKLSFDSSDSAFSANAGCNTLFGEYHADAGKLRFANIGTTLMGCQQALMHLDNQLAANLDQSATWQMQDGALEIRNAQGKVLIKAQR